MKKKLWPTLTRLRVREAVKYHRDHGRAPVCFAIYNVIFLRAWTSV